MKIRSLSIWLVSLVLTTLTACASPVTPELTITPTPTPRPTLISTPVPTLTPIFTPTPSPTPAPTFTPTPTALPPTPTFTSPSSTVPSTPPTDIKFTSDRSIIKVGMCINFAWEVAQAKAVYFYAGNESWEDKAVPLTGTRQVCQKETTTYYLRVVRLDDAVEIKELRIPVEALPGL